MDVEWKDRNKFIKRQSGRRFEEHHELAQLFEIFLVQRPATVQFYVLQ